MICSCHRNKHFENVKKFGTEILHLRLDILVVQTMFREKLRFFVACVKKTKEMPRKQPFLTPKFVFLTHDTKNVGFPWNNFVNTECRDIRVKFFVQIF
jgi:hypothetical protein